jgi:hypothetical protein
VVTPAGGQLWRIHRSDRDAAWFGPSPGGAPCNRFDAPGGEYRVCYLGDSPEVAFAETLIRQTHTRMVLRSQLDERSASRISLLRNLKLARFHGPGLVRLGVDAEVAHCHPYERCQALALDLWKHGDAVDGIEYRSRWDNDRLCVALFDRAGDALDAPDHTLSLGEPGLLVPILRLYEIGLA